MSGEWSEYYCARSDHVCEVIHSDHVWGYNLIYDNASDKYTTSLAKCSDDLCFHTCCVDSYTININKHAAHMLGSRCWHPLALQHHLTLINRCFHVSQLRQTLLFGREMQLELFVVLDELSQDILAQTLWTHHTSLLKMQWRAHHMSWKRHMNEINKKVSRALFSINKWQIYYLWKVSGLYTLPSYTHIYHTES